MREVQKREFYEWFAEFGGFDHPLGIKKCVQHRYGLPLTLLATTMAHTAMNKAPV